MRIHVLTVCILMTLHGAAHAESIVTKNCAKKNGKSVPSELSNFATEAQRRIAPEQYVQKIETLIRNSPFKDLLECRDRLEADPQFKYSLRFLGQSEGSMMSVTRSYQGGGMMGGQTSISLNFDLKGSPQKLLFVYLHELTHVCQALKWANLHSKYDIVRALPKIFPNGNMTMIPYGTKKCDQQLAIPSNSDITEEYIRYRKLGEVEAFYNMTKAYQHFTGLDPSFCRGNKDDGSANLYQGYLEMEAMINQGYFAQDIIVKYQEEDTNKSETAAALFDQSAPKKLYPDGVLRPSLNRELVRLIESLELPFVEPK